VELSWQLNAMDSSQVVSHVKTEWMFISKSVNLHYH